ncbi:craniofacial development protein 2-like [Aphis craccivora]|uniref:Craniofacial development protein 2-like n=1 Tax=Aphis craccivora TaxID=307492 RepID=A0A6G0YRK3_APHCR|nr:craniofacial development protein 2-like [Aphis craccivora]
MSTKKYYGIPLKTCILRHESLSKTVIEGDVEGHIGRGRPRMEYMKQIIIDMGKNSYKELKELMYTYKVSETGRLNFSNPLVK